MYYFEQLVVFMMETSLSSSWCMKNKHFSCGFIVIFFLLGAFLFNVPCRLLVQVLIFMNERMELLDGHFTLEPITVYLD